MGGAGQPTEAGNTVSPVHWWVVGLTQPTGSPLALKAPSAQKSPASLEPRPWGLHRGPEFTLGAPVTVWGPGHRC